MRIASCRFLLCVCLTFCANLVFAQDGRKLVVTGSDSMAALMLAWATAFSDWQPDTIMEIQAAGSAAAPTALAEGTASFGAMSRPMNGKELERFVTVKGFLPAAIQVATDEIAVIVHRQNPVVSLRIQDLDRIFSANQQCGGGGPLTYWHQLPQYSDRQGAQTHARAIEPYGRTSLSGSYGLFKKKALCEGDYAAGVIELPGFAAVVDAVASAETAIGYVSRSFADERVKLVPVSGGSFIIGLQTKDNSRGNPSYPLARNLYFYLATPPGSRAGRLECTFLDFLDTDQARLILQQQGFKPPEKVTGIDAVNSVDVSDVCF